jgi:nucleotide-binding universal stress UspA family protein
VVVAWHRGWSAEQVDQVVGRFGQLRAGKHAAQPGTATRKDPEIMTNKQMPIVVVGVRDSTGSRGAIRLAAREAAYRGAALLAVMAYSADSPLGAPAGRPLAVLHNSEEDHLVAEAALRDAVIDALGDQAQGVTVQAVPGQGGRVLVDAAERFNAALLVVAGREGAITPGTVSQYVLRRAPCPVLVVPPVLGDRA